MARPAQGARRLRNDALYQGRCHSPVLELRHSVPSLCNSLRSPQSSLWYRQRTSATSKDAVQLVWDNTFVLNTLRCWACRYL